jgi:hypothetical protein
MLNRKHQPVHSFLLILDGLNQFELCPAAVKVVARAMHFEIRVSRQIVGEEPYADLERDQLA